MKINKKIIIADVENLPAISTIWGIWNQNIPINAILEDGYMVGFGWKYLGDVETHYIECRKSEDEKQMLKEISKILDKVDIVIGHNFRAFDLKTIKARMVKHNIKPFSPVKIIDTLSVCRKEFRLISNKLAYVAEFLGVGEKSEHTKFQGHRLWLECLRGNDEAFDEMRDYCKIDVDVTESVYYRLLPYISNHPNIVSYTKDSENIHDCAKCGSNNIIRKGSYTTNSCSYKRYLCKDCGSWLKHKKKDSKQSTKLRSI